MVVDGPLGDPTAEVVALHEGGPPDPTSSPMSATRTAPGQAGALAQAEAGLEGGEGHGDLGGQRPSGDLAGEPVDARGNVDGEDGGRRQRRRVEGARKPVP